MEQIITNNIGHSSRCYRVKCKNFTNWYTVHDLEEVKEILDDVEKEYLKSVIKPFKNKVLGIQKKSKIIKPKEYIRFIIKKDLDIYFPDFDSGSMYKGMELEKEYSLKELGLDD